MPGSSHPNGVPIQCAPVFWAELAHRYYPHKNAGRRVDLGRAYGLATESGDHPSGIELAARVHGQWADHDLIETSTTPWLVGLPVVAHGRRASDTLDLPKVQPLPTRRRRDDCGRPAVSDQCTSEIGSTMGERCTTHHQGQVPTHLAIPARQRRSARASPCRVLVVPGFALVNISRTVSRAITLYRRASGAARSASSRCKVASASRFRCACAHARSSWTRPWPPGPK